MQTQQNKLIKRLRKGWLNSLQAVYECDCLKLTTRVNEVAFLLKINALGLKLVRKPILVPHKQARYLTGLYRRQSLSWVLP